MTRVRSRGVLLALALAWGFGSRESTWAQGRPQPGKQRAAAADEASGEASLDEQDGRLNTVYKELLGQMSGDSTGLAGMRREEREWIRRRDQRCGKEVGCLTRLTADRAEELATKVEQTDRSIKAAGKVKAGGEIPPELWGTWMIRKVLPAETISCWNNAQARALVGTELNYHPDWFAWKKTRVGSLGATVSTVMAKQFAEDNSGGGANSSQVSFQQLGIGAPSLKQVVIRHPEVKMADGTMEVPGETVLETSPLTLVFSVCNVYFEASR